MGATFLTVWGHILYFLHVPDIPFLCDNLKIKNAPVICVPNLEVHTCCELSLSASWFRLRDMDSESYEQGYQPTGM